MLLRFRVANHRSIRDEAELSMISPSLRTVTAPGGNWSSSTVRVAAVYGPNAAGKSNLLSAVDFLVDAVHNSATLWADQAEFPYSPFRLDGKSATEPSFYEVSVTADGVRYDYGFTSDAAGVHSEWLHSYPQGRKRRLLSRAGPTSDEVTIRFGSAEENNALLRLVSPGVLALSAAARVKHSALRTISDAISGLRYARFSDSDRLNRLAMIRDLANAPNFTTTATALLAMADVGISGIQLGQKQVTGNLLTVAKALLQPPGSEISNAAENDLVERALEHLGKQLVFLHGGSGSPDVQLLEDEQSSGTLAWLSLAFPALLACDYGQTLLVDELDASLHPRLSAALVGIFKDPELNPTGAQLIFTTHDVAFMNPSFQLLAPEEVWFTDKAQGATALYSLAEFSTRTGDNFAKRYLDGRYGAVPMIDIEPLRAIRRTRRDKQRDEPTAP